MVCAVPADVLRKYYGLSEEEEGWYFLAILSSSNTSARAAIQEKTCVRRLTHWFGQGVQAKHSLCRRHIEEQCMWDIAGSDGTQGHHFG